MARKTVTFLMTALFMILLSCSGGGREDRERKEQVQATIMRYQQLLSEGYRKQDMNPLQLAATQEHATRLYHHMAALGESRSRMLSELKGIDFRAIRFPARDRAVVETRETWDFAHENMDSHAKTLEKKGFRYDMTYDLRYDGRRWLVADAKAAPEEAGTESAGKAR